VTPCQIRTATNALIRLRFEEAALKVVYTREELLARLERTARILAYHQRRNAAARQSHGKSRVAKFLARGIDPAQLPPCPVNSAL